MPETQFYTVNELATILNVKPSTVRDHAAKGILPAIRVGRLWRFPRQRFDTWLERRLPPVEPAEAVWEEPDDAMDAETRAWLEADLMEPLPPYEWGPEGIPPVQPVSYEPGVGFVVEEEA